MSERSSIISGETAGGAGGPRRDRPEPGLSKAKTDVEDE
jgi:hypothetical protein